MLSCQTLSLIRVVVLGLTGLICLAWDVAFAAMGTFTGAAYLLLFVWCDLQGRL